jgi:DNA-binding LacI/PurR family transcriptional regulator
MTGPSRVTHRDIAEKFGCSRATVSLALSDHPRIRKINRDKIKALAEQMGYRPDPSLTMLARHRFSPRNAHFRGTLAYIVDSKHSKEAPYELQTRHLLPARHRADERGYQVFEFDLADYPSSEAASNVLYSRGVSGILLPTLPQSAESLLAGDCWNRFTIVSCSLGWLRGPYHIVTNDVFEGASLAWRKVIERGYTRIGGAVFKHTPTAQDDFARLGAFVAQQEEFIPEKARIPLLRCGPFDRDAFLAWFEQHRPEVVISFLSRAAEWLTSAGYRLPEDVAFACLGVWPREPFAGIAMPTQQLGEAAADFLIDQIHGNQRGIPKTQLSLLVEPQWQEGKTLPYLKAAKNDGHRR